MTDELQVDSKSVADSQGDVETVGESQEKSGDIVFMMAASEDPTTRPELSEFVKVEPRNLSATSISFYCNDAPTGDSIVLLMGDLDENPICVSAAVTSCNEGFWERKRRYLVGCELTGRL